MYRPQTNTTFGLLSNIGLFVAVFSLVLCALLSPINAQTTSTTSTCTDSSNCTVRSWLASLQGEAASMDCVSVKLQKSIAMLNASSNANSTDMLTIINKRVIQLNKLKAAMYSLSLEIQAINVTCTKFDGPDCNVVKVATTTSGTTSSSPFSAAALLSMGDLANSTILNITQADRFVRDIVNGTASSIAMKLLYRGSRDGMSAASFHAKCDNKGATITLVKAAPKTIYGEAVFGGFTTISWQSAASLTYSADPKAFLFSVISGLKEERFAKVAQTINANQAYAVASKSDYGPTFGGGHDMCVKFSNSYFSVNTYGYGTGLVREYYTGDQYFIESEIEVYTIN